MTALVLTPAQAVVVANALADAERYRQYCSTWCADCAAASIGICQRHLADFDQAHAYRRLRDTLAPSVPHQKGQPQCREHLGWP